MVVRVRDMYEEPSYMVHSGGPGACSPKSPSHKETPVSLSLRNGRIGIQRSANSNSGPFLWCNSGCIKGKGGANQKNQGEKLSF